MCVAARVRMGVCITQLHPSPANVHDFLNVEARRVRARVCECGRAREPSDSVCGCCGTGSMSGVCVLCAARAALASVHYVAPRSGSIREESIFLFILCCWWLRPPPFPPQFSCVLLSRSLAPSPARKYKFSHTFQRTSLRVRHLSITSFGF